MISLILFLGTAILILAILIAIDWNSRAKAFYRRHKLAIDILAIALYWVCSSSFFYLLIDVLSS